MSDFDPAVWTALSGLLNTQWPEVSGQVFRAVQVDRTNWLNLLNGNQITPPYVIADILPRRLAEEWGMQCKAYFYPAEIYYIADVASAGNVVASVTAKVVLVRDALLAVTSGFQVVTDPIIDLSEENPANQAFYQLPKAPGLFAGQIRADLLAGEIY